MTMSTISWAKELPGRSTLIEEGLFRPFPPLDEFPVQVAHFVTVPKKSAQSKVNLAEFYNENSFFVNNLKNKFDKCDKSDERYFYVDGKKTIFDHYNCKYKCNNGPDTKHSRFLYQRHRSFATYTFCKYGNLHLNNDDWADFEKDLQNIDPQIQIPGLYVSAVNVRLIDSSDNMQDYSDEGLKNNIKTIGKINRDRIIRTNIAGNRVVVWVDFETPGQSDDSFENILIYLKARFDSLGVEEAALIIQHLLLIESYRTMALYELQEANKSDILDSIQDYENKLQAIVSAESSNINEIERHLDEIIKTSSMIEKSIADNCSSLSGAQAHQKIALRFIDELDEERFSGFLSIQQFLHRSIDPAMQTTETISQRLEQISNHASHVTDLLRTQIEVNSLKEERGLASIMFFLAFIAGAYYAGSFFDKAINSFLGMLMDDDDQADSQDSQTSEIVEVAGTDLPVQINSNAQDFVTLIVSVIIVVVWGLFAMKKSFREKCLRPQMRIVESIVKTTNDINQVNEGETDLSKRDPESQTQNT